MKKTILLLSIVMAAMTANAATSLPTIYVDWTNGSDVLSSVDPVTYGDGTLAHPWKRLSKALSALGAQTTEVILAPGIYVENNIPSLSVACPNLVIKGANAATTIIDGSQVPYANGRLLKTASLYETSSNNLTIQDLTFTKGGYGTLGNDAGGTIYFRNNGAAYTNNLTLTRVIFDDNKLGSTSSTLPKNGAALYFNGANLTINDCYFKNNKASVGTSTALNTSVGGAIFIIPYTGKTGAFVSINNTTFDGNEAGQSGGAVEVANFTYGTGMVKSALVTPAVGAPNSYLKFTNCTFVNNLVRKNPVLGTTDAVTGTAIHASTDVATSFIYDFTVVNCTFANNTGGSTNAAGVGVAPWESKSTVDFDGTNYATATFVNNIINTTATANCGSALMVNAATGGTKFFGSNNIIESAHANITDATFYTAGANATNVASTLTNNSTASVFAVPYLELATGSNAINAGVNNFGTPEIVPILDVRSASIATVKDLGAFEINGVITNLKPLSIANTFTVAQSGANFTVNGIDNAAYTVYSVSGSQVATGVIKAGSFQLNANKGIYLLKVNGQVAKFSVR